MTRPDGYATPAAFWTAVRAAVRNDAGKSGVPARDLVQLQLFDRFLSRVNADPDTTPFRLKGGTRMLAFIPSARATVDIDLEVARYGVDAAVDTLADLVRVDNGDRLRFVLTKRRRSHGSDDQPGIAMVALTFTAVGINQQVKIDLAVHDRAGARTIRAAPKFRVPLGRDVPAAEYVMIAVEEQIADKVAAMMERRHGDGNGDGRSSRAKDLVDLALIAQHLPVDAVALRAALTTQINDRHLEPFTVVDASPMIQAGYATVARKARGLTLTWREAESLTNRLIGPVLDGRISTGRWEPGTGFWGAAAQADLD
ncbi:nucleotidyl transferase AbiEii/AbiGii toxin family protein [Curtobacterium sp. MCPF17_021]|uniref:nucleotidyl transferase AbiEii/AbiGii toxin family protein n=1 Tax=Curtobacterium sp. MCPF17_021 TaxID=2175639 RepID=UPI000DA7E87A|nr:nucleotidyl transferase AbiEii/AbiGii toxin family protein [Curtobacterium sp. MCPF17_021]WIE85114.1 nucleotidyl transferase AbiEii/AbiGii toxin family protein [Curtobacterium sp. MCPF17_021]